MQVCVCTACSSIVFADEDPNYLTIIAQTTVNASVSSCNGTCSHNMFGMSWQRPASSKSETAAANGEVTAQHADCWSPLTSNLLSLQASASTGRRKILADPPGPRRELLQTTTAAPEPPPPPAAQQTLQQILTEVTALQSGQVTLQSDITSLQTEVDAANEAAAVRHFAQAPHHKALLPTMVALVLSVGPLLVQLQPEAKLSVTHMLCYSSAMLHNCLPPCRLGQRTAACRPSSPRPAPTLPPGRLRCRPC